MVDGSWINSQTSNAAVAIVDATTVILLLYEVCSTGKNMKEAPHGKEP
jgi:hypothetical protein